MGINDLIIRFLDGGGVMIASKKLTAIPLKEECIISKSIEWYRDPEPCMIHRSAVMKTIYIQFFDYFSGLLEKSIRQTEWEEVPEELRAMVDVGGEIHGISLII